MSTPGMGASIFHGFTKETFTQYSQDTITAYQSVMAEVFAELVLATAKFPPMNTMHEGWAILREEVDELWDEVKANNPDRAIEEPRQVAAMAIRFIHDMQALRAEKGE